MEGNEPDGTEEILLVTAIFSNVIKVLSPDGAHCAQKLYHDLNTSFNIVMSFCFPAYKQVHPCQNQCGHDLPDACQSTTGQQRDQPRQYTL